MHVHLLVHATTTVSYLQGSGLDDPDNLGHLGHFFGDMGQVGLIHKLNYLDVTQISHVL